MLVPDLTDPISVDGKGASVEAREKYGIFNCPNCGAAPGPGSVSCGYCGSSLATRVCASCFGAVTVGMHHCPWCGAGSELEQPALQAEQKCPRCTVRLSEVNVGGHALKECAVCGGLWVDKETLRQICAKEEEQEAVLGFAVSGIPGGAAPEGTQGRVYVPCPVCRKLMNRRQFAGCSRVIVDWCKEHGTWFDRRELHEIVRFVRDGGLKKSREREKRLIEEEKKHLRNRQMMPTAGFTSAIECALISQTGKEDKDTLLRVLSSVWHAFEE